MGYHRILSSLFLIYLLVNPVYARVILTGLYKNVVDISGESAGGDAASSYTISVRCENGDRAILWQLLEETGVENTSISESNRNIEVICSESRVTYELTNITQTPLGSGVISVTSGVDARLSYHTSLDLVRKEKGTRLAERDRRRADNRLARLERHSRKRIVLLTAVAVGITLGNAIAEAMTRDRTFPAQECPESFPDNIEKKTNNIKFAYLLSCIVHLQTNTGGINKGLKDALESMEQILGELQKQTENLQAQINNTQQFLGNLTSSIQQTISTAQQALGISGDNAIRDGLIAQYLAETRKDVNENYAFFQNELALRDNTQAEIVSAFNMEVQNINENFAVFTGAVEREFKRVYENMYSSFAKTNDQISRLDIDVSLRLTRLAETTETAINRLLDTTARQSAEQSRANNLIDRLYQTIQELAQVEYAVPGLIVAYWGTIDRVLALNDTIVPFLNELGDRPLNPRNWSYVSGRTFTGRAWNYRTNEQCNDTSLTAIYPLLNDYYKSTKTKWEVPVAQLQRFHHFFDKLSLGSFRTTSTLSRGPRVEMGICHNAKVVDNVPTDLNHPDANNTYQLPSNTEPNVYLCHRRVDRNETYNEDVNAGATFCPEASGSYTVNCGEELQLHYSSISWEHAAFTTLTFKAIPVLLRSIRPTMALGDVVMFRATTSFDGSDIEDAHWYLYLEISKLVLKKFESVRQAEDDTMTHFKLDFLRTPTSRTYIWIDGEEASPRRPYLTNNTCTILRPFNASLESMHFRANVPNVTTMLTGRWFPRYHYELVPDSTDGPDDADCIYLSRDFLDQARKKREDTLTLPPESVPPVPRQARSSHGPVISYPPMQTRYKNLECQQTWVDRTKGLTEGKLYKTANYQFPLYKTSPHTILELEDLDASIGTTSSSPLCLSQPECMLASVPLPRKAWIQEEGGQMLETPAIPFTNNKVEYKRKNISGKTLILVVPSGVMVEVCTNALDVPQSDTFTICDAFRGPTFTSSKDSIGGLSEMYSDTLTYNVTVPNPRDARVLVKWIDSEQVRYKAMCVTTKDFGEGATQTDILANRVQLSRDTLRSTCSSQNTNNYNGIFIASLEFARNSPHGYFGITMAQEPHIGAEWTGVNVVFPAGPYPGTDSTRYLSPHGNQPVYPPVPNSISVIHRTPLRTCWRECVTLSQVSAEIQKSFCTEMLGEKCEWQTVGNPRRNECREKPDLQLVAFSTTCTSPETDPTNAEKSAWECINRGLPGMECLWDPGRAPGSRCIYFPVDTALPRRARPACSARVSNPADRFQCTTLDSLYLDQSFALPASPIPFATDMCMYQFDPLNPSMHRDENWCIRLREGDPSFGLFARTSEQVSRGHRCLDAGVQCDFGPPSTTDDFYKYTEPATPDRTKLSDFSENFNERNWRGLFGCRAYDRVPEECARKSSAPSINRFFNGKKGLYDSMCEGTVATCTQKCEYFRTAHSCVTGTSSGKCTWVFDNTKKSSFPTWDTDDISADLASSDGFFVPYDGTIESVVIISYTETTYSGPGPSINTISGRKERVKGNSVITSTDSIETPVYYVPDQDIGFCTKNTFNPATRFDLCGQDGETCANRQSYCNIYNNDYNHTMASANETSRTESRLENCRKDPQCVHINATEEYCASLAVAASLGCTNHTYSTCTPDEEEDGISGAISLLREQCIIQEEGAIWEDCLFAATLRKDADPRRQCAMELCVQTRQTTVEKCEDDDANSTCDHCVFVEVGDTGSRQCYSSGDPQLHQIQAQYPDLVTITLYDDYITTSPTHVLVNVSLEDLSQDDTYLRNRDMVMGELRVEDVYGTTGLRGVPDAVQVFFPCEDKVEAVRIGNETFNLTRTYSAIGRLCCQNGTIETRVYGTTEYEACAPDDGTGYITYENPHHPRNQFHAIALDQCEDQGADANEKRDAYLIQRTIDIYYMCKLTPAGGNYSQTDDELDPGCAINENTTGIQPLPGLICFPYVHEEDCRNNLCQFLPAATNCRIDADIGNTGEVERLVRLDSRILAAVQSYDGYPLYNDENYAIIQWHDMESRPHGKSLPDLILNGSSLNPIPLFETVLSVDILTAVTSLYTFFGSNPAAWGGTLGDVESISRSNVKVLLPDGTSQRLLKHNEAKYAWHTRDFVPIYRYNNPRRECFGKIVSGNKTLPSVSCIADGQHDNLMPLVNSLMIHHRDPVRGIVVNPPTERIVPGGGPGSVGGFHTFGGLEITKDEFIRRIPTYDTDIFQTSPWLYSNPIQTDKPWCGQMLRTYPDQDSLFSSKLVETGLKSGSAFESLLSYQTLVDANLTMPSDYLGSGAGKKLADFWGDVVGNRSFYEDIVGTGCAESESRREDPSQCNTKAVWLTRIVNASAAYWSFYGCTLPFTNFFMTTNTTSTGADLIHILFDGFLCHIGEISPNLSSYSSEPGNVPNYLLMHLCQNNSTRSNWYYSTPVNGDGQPSQDELSPVEDVLGTVFILPKAYAQCGNCVDQEGVIGACKFPNYIVPMRSDLSARYGLCAISEQFDIEWDMKPGRISFSARPRTVTMDLVFQVPSLEFMVAAKHAINTCPELEHDMECDPIWRRCEVRLSNPLAFKNLDFVRMVSTQAECVLPGFTKIHVEQQNTTIWVLREVLGPNAHEVFKYELCAGLFSIRHVPFGILRSMIEQNSTSNTNFTHACNQTSFVVQIAKTRNEESFVGLPGVGTLRMAGEISVSKFGEVFQDLVSDVITDRVTDVTYTKAEVELLVEQSIVGVRVGNAALFQQFLDEIQIGNLVRNDIETISQGWVYDRGNRNQTRNPGNPDFLGDIQDHIGDTIKDIGKLNSTYENIKEELSTNLEEYNAGMTELQAEFNERNNNITKDLEALRDLISTLSNDKSGVSDVIAWTALGLGIFGGVVGIVSLALAIRTPNKFSRGQLDLKPKTEISPLNSRLPYSRVY